MRDRLMQIALAALAMLLMVSCGEVKNEASDAVTVDNNSQIVAEEPYLDEYGYPLNIIGEAYDKWYSDNLKLMNDAEEKLSYIPAIVLKVNHEIGHAEVWSQDTHFDGCLSFRFEEGLKVTRSGRECDISELSPGQQVVICASYVSSAPIETEPMSIAVFSIRILPDLDYSQIPNDDEPILVEEPRLDQDIIVESPLE